MSLREWQDGRALNNEFLVFQIATCVRAAQNCSAHSRITLRLFNEMRSLMSVNKSTLGRCKHDTETQNTAMQQVYSIWQTKRLDTKDKQLLPRPQVVGAQNSYFFCLLSRHPADDSNASCSSFKLQSSENTAPVALSAWLPAVM